MRAALLAWACLLVAHELLAWHMAHGNVVAHMLSPGQHTPVVSVLTALAFIGFRLLIIVVMPAIAAGRLALYALASHRRRVSVEASPVQ